MQHTVLASPQKKRLPRVPQPPVYAAVDEAYEMYTVGDSFLHEVEKMCHPLLIQRLADWRIGGLIEAASAEGTLTIG